MAFQDDLKALTGGNYNPFIERYLNSVVLRGNNTGFQLRYQLFRLEQGQIVPSEEIALLLGDAVSRLDREAGIRLYRTAMEAFNNPRGVPIIGSDENLTDDVITYIRRHAGLGEPGEFLNAGEIVTDTVSPAYPSAATTSISASATAAGVLTADEAELRSNTNPANALLHNILDNNRISLLQLDRASGIANQTLSRYGRQTTPSLIPSDRLGALLLGLARCQAPLNDIARLGHLVRPDLSEQWFSLRINLDTAISLPDIPATTTRQETPANTSFRSTLRSNKISLERLADASGISSSALGRYRTGSRPIPPESLSDLLLGLARCQVPLSDVARLGHLVRSDLSEEWFSGRINRDTAISLPDITTSPSSQASAPAGALTAEVTPEPTTPAVADTGLRTPRDDPANILFRELLENNGISLARLEAESGVSNSTLGRYRAGQLLIASERLGDILFGLSHCGIDPEDLIRLGHLARPELSEAWFSERIEQAIQIEQADLFNTAAGWDVIRHPALSDPAWLATQENRARLVFSEIITHDEIAINTLETHSGISRTTLNSYRNEGSPTTENLCDLLLGLTRCDATIPYLARLANQVRPELSEAWFNVRIEQAVRMEQGTPSDMSGWDIIRHPALYDNTWLATQENQAGPVLRDIINLHEIELRTLETYSGISNGHLSRYSTGEDTIPPTRLVDLLMGLSHCDVATNHLARLGHRARPELSEAWFSERIEQAIQIEQAEPSNTAGWDAIRYPALSDPAWLATQENQLGQLLSELRRSLNLTERELHSRSGVYFTNISRIENHEDRITPTILDRLLVAMEAVAVEQGTQISFTEHAARIRTLAETRMGGTTIVPESSGVTGVEGRAEDLSAERIPSDSPAARTNVAGGTETQLPTGPEHIPNQASQQDNQQDRGG